MKRINVHLQGALWMVLVSGALAGQLTVLSARVTSERSEVFLGGKRFALTLEEEGSLGLLRQRMKGLRPDGPVEVLWRDQAPPIEWFGRLSAAVSGQGEQRIAQEMHGGGSRFVRLWSVSAGAVSVATRDVESVYIGQSKELGGAERWIDLASPAVFFLSDTPWIVFDTLGIADGRRKVVVGAFDDLLTGNQEVHEITTGIDPRVSVWQDRAVLAVRRPTNASEAHGSAPVALFESVDGSTWVELASSEENSIRAARGFDIQLSGAGLFLGTPDSLGTGIEIYRYETAIAAWVHIERVPVPELDLNRKNLFWFEGTNSVGGRPAVLIRDALGELVER